MASVAFAFRIKEVLFSCILLLNVALFSCNSEKKQELTEAEYRERLENVNRIMVRDEKKDIDDFITRHQFRMESSGTGLRYQVLSTGSGPRPKEHDQVILAYRVYDLAGTLLYDITKQDPDTFRMAEGNRVRGLEEALRLFPEGTHARVVLPAHLAYGMIGNDDKIAGATALYYDLQLLDVQP
ncbi:MAG: hypothetical protein RL021_600 [Bacteroidota bacterium]|jgi:FKBP-type peptidyl-prolyl cis-trans isomerase